jgi:hypothetical protein
MPQNIRRRLFGRIVLWDSKTSTIIDLPSRNVLSFAGPSESEEYVRLANGDREVISRSHTAQIPITAQEASELSDVLQRIGGTFRAVFLGISGTDSWLWLEPTRLQVTDPEVSPGQLSEKVLELNTNVFYPAIWQGMSIFEGVPWRGTIQLEQNGNKVLRPKNNIRSGYEGPLWSVGSNCSVNLEGKSFGIDSNNEAVLGIQFPVWGCSLYLDSEDESYKNAIVEARSIDFNILESSNKDIKIPPQTYFIRVVIDQDVDRPVELKVKNVGESKGVLAGSIDDEPIWSTRIVLTGENI